MSGLMDAVRAGRTAETVALLDGMTDAERRAEFPALKELRKELRAARWGAESRRAYPALHAAGAACQTGAAGVATWIAAADMRWPGAAPAVFLHLLGDRDPAWLADVVHRLAQRPASSGVRFELMAGLVRLAGCPVPTTDAYVRGWAQHMAGLWQRGGHLADRLRGEPQLRELVRALFATDDIGGVLGWGSEEGPHSWHGALALLTADGRLDRAETVDACVARLLRGGSTGDHRAFLRVLKALGLTREEERARVADWVAMASDAASPVAAHAQALLGALALDGELPHRALAQLSAAVLFRPERKLVRTQLVLLGKVLGRGAGAADALLPTVAGAFGHEDADVQERALKLVERHLKKLRSTEARASVVAAAGQLGPALRGRATGSLGAAPLDASALVHEEILPPVPGPARLAPAPSSPAELAEEVGAALAAESDSATFERTLDGLVRHAFRDAAALREALEPVVARRWWAETEEHAAVRVESRFHRHYRGLVGTSDALDLLLVALHEKVSVTRLHRATQAEVPRHLCGHGALSHAFDSRVWEVAYRIRTRPLPFLLATPTWSTGLLEPGELVTRLEEYGRLGARVAAADFAQALLRVRREDRAAAEAAARRAAALGTAEGARLARWLAEERPELPVVRRTTSGPAILTEFGELRELQQDFPPAFRALGRPVSASQEGRDCYHWYDSLKAQWPAVLPERRELVAVRMLRDLSHLALHDVRGMSHVLPLLAESGGEAGETTHLAVAYGLGARHPEDRLAAVDALLVLAARGQLDAPRLGADLGQLIRRGAVKPLRLVDSLRTAAATGAHTTVWNLLGHTLPVLLADLATDGPAAPVRGLGELLAVAAECAERSGARGELPHLAGAAERRGSSRVVTEARRLRGALTAGLAA
ncbi:DUF6493 family protein [Streptomyces sp. NPDC059631]|uniref:DUF7824 domain-containing protein n=1 Tax=unclassified Streptomyces TaxID=2593676 RepID=UPI0036C61D35